MLPRPLRQRWTRLVAVVCLLTLSSTSAVVLAVDASAAPATTAWQNGRFALDTGAVVSRSDIVLGVPNTPAAQSLGLGNGSLGVAAWAAGGFTAQLNRTDTMPNRRSPGQVKIPGLSAMTSASDFTGRLDLYNGVLTESGGGITLKAWVPSGKDELIVDVTGVDPNSTQTATLNLWSGRSPAAAASGSIATLAETWVDNSEQQPSGRTFGSLAAITAGGRGVAASVVSSSTVQVGFRPNADGSFRVVVGAPTWTGGNAASTAASLLGSDATASSSSLLSSHQSWWHDFWAGSGLVALSSADGSAEYMEALRTIYLYTEAASMRGTYPGSQAGVANMFNFGQDRQIWTPSSTWLWNLRTQISANMTTGNYALNTPIFDLYLNNIPAMQTWTKAQMGNRAGICVPEVMRFNGNGGNPASGANASCSQPGSPNWTALIVTSGAEISTFVWQQYQATGDVSFLRRYYPLLQQSAIFLLAYHTRGADGLLHAVANAHETQWAVQDPTTNIVAMQALFPAVISAAQKLGTDSALASQLQTALGQLPPYARTDQATRTQLLPASADANNNTVIAPSYQPTATIRNSENIGLEPVWPWSVIGDNSNLLALAKRTYQHRPVTNGLDWSLDAIQAARLGLADEVKARLISITGDHQVYINGLADLGSTVDTQGYLEQAAGVAVGVNEALVQNYDGLLRFAPAWPSGWDAGGTVYIQNGSKVDVQVQDGTLVTAAIHAGATQTLRVRNPWPGQATEVVNGSSGAVVVAGTTAGTIDVPTTAGQTYLVQRTSARTTALPFSPVTGTRATTAKHLGGVKIGLDGPGGVPGPTFYTDAGYGGTGVKLGTGSYTIAQMQAAGVANDAISSIRVPSGYTVVAYADGDFTGTSWTFTADNANLASTGNDNVISSFRIAGGTPPPPAVTRPTFYPDAGYGGTGVALGTGTYTIAQMQAAGIANDAVSSIRVPSGYTVVAYQDGDFTGASWTFTSDTANLASAGGDNAISSFRITNGTTPPPTDPPTDPPTNPPADVGATTTFTSFEAEAGTLGGGAAAVSLTSAPTTRYSSPELESSGHAYVRLNGNGQSVRWTNTTGKPASFINVRASIPDAANGGGTTSTLNLYVDGAFRQAIDLNSRQSWLYEGVSYNENDQRPSSGNPRVFFDDAHAFITGAPVAPGSTITLQKDAANGASSYLVDVVDLENPPAPLAQPANSISITSCGAVAGTTPTNGAAPSNAVDSTNAIQTCINQAQSQGRTLWIPQGTFYLKGTTGLRANGITIAGAGMWFSNIYRSIPLPNSTPLAAIVEGTSTTIQDLHLDSNAISRTSPDGGGGATDITGTNWVTNRIWAEHVLSGTWASGTGGKVSNSRFTSIWADGINVNNVSNGGTVGNRLTVTNNFVRGTGDDAIAINSVDYNVYGGQTITYTPMSNVTLTNNTSIAPWGGKGIGIYGGGGHVVQNNYISDTARYIGLGVGKFGANGSNLTSATVQGNRIVRSGGNAYDQGQPALHIGNGGDGHETGSVAGAVVAGNTIVGSLYDAVGYSASTGTTLRDTTITNPGRNGIVISPPFYPAPTGSTTITGNTVTGLKAGSSAFVNNSSGFTATVTNNSWQGGGSPNPPTTPTAGAVSLRSRANNSYVTAENAGASALIANRAAVGAWETFDLINNANGSISLRAHANDSYVTAENAGAAALIANRTAIGGWEEFDLVRNTNGSVSLRAHANNSYVSAADAGASALIANRATIGGWEEFDLIYD